MIDRVTITGADDSIRPEQLIPLTEEFPFVEWGILASENNTFKAGGSNRYPSPRWIADLQGVAESTGALRHLALHINGRWVRDMLLGNLSLPTNLLHCFLRVQLNFHAERTTCDPEKFARVLTSSVFTGREFIFQLDGAHGNRHLDAAYDEEVFGCSGLFDESGGAGLLPPEWPSPIFIEMDPGEHGEGVQYHAYHGYAGGLGPDNLAEQIPRILKAAAGTEHTLEGRIWIDMETRVRSRNDQQFDLNLVRKCLEIASKFVGVRV